LAPTPPAVEKKPALTPEQRAAKLGFVRHLPQQTEVVMSFYDNLESIKRIKAGKLWRALSDEVEQAVTEADDAQGEPQGPSALFAKEFTIAVGPTTGDQTANLLTLNKRVTYFQMRALAAAFAEAAESGDFSAMQEAMGSQFGPQLAKDLLGDPEGGLALLERMKMPPLYLAFKTSADGREAAAQQIAALVENLGMLGPVVEAVEAGHAGSRFAGHKIVGAKVAESMEEARAGLQQMLEPAAVDRLFSAIAAKDLVVLSGTLGDYVVMFIGSSPDDLKFAESPADSLVTGDALAFCDGYAEKKLAAVIRGDKQAITTMVNAASGLAHMCEGLRDGLAGAEGLGDTRDIETLLRMVAEREDALRALSSTREVGVAAFFEDGLKLESYGGTDYGAVDWKAGNRLASLGDSEDVALFVNMTGVPAYDEKASAYFEALMETTYALAMKVAEVPGGEGQLGQYKEAAKLFDSRFRPEAVALWEALSGDFGHALGKEGALVVDLNGTVPAIPGLPQAVVDGGKFPRITLVSPVTDRAKLASAWQQVNTSVTSILGKVGEMNGTEIPMQKPISSDKDGFTTWFFPLPFFNDDFVPSVTVGDQWFAASTSKNQATDLLGKAAATSESRSGFLMAVNFNALRKFAGIALDVVAKNPDALPMDAADLEKIRKLVAALEALDKLTIHARQEDGMLRTSVHLKTR
jgi:hypothetical protein